MSDERTITERLEERPAFHADELRQVSARELFIRFAAGAGASILAGLVSLLAGPRAGGVFLALPAILAASLTLIAEEDDTAEAREDVRGASIGGLALAAFAAVVALMLPSVDGAITLCAATGAWFLVAFAGYGAAWYRRS